MTLQELLAKANQLKNEYNVIVNAEDFKALGEDGEDSAEQKAANEKFNEWKEANAAYQNARQAAAMDAATTLDKPEDKPEVKDTAVDKAELFNISEDEAAATVNAQMEYFGWMCKGGTAAANRWRENNKAKAKLIENSETREAMNLAASLDLPVGTMSLNQLRDLATYNALTSGGANKGAEYMPKDVAAVIYKQLEEMSPMRGLCQVMTRDSMAEFHIPTGTNTGHAHAANVAEATPSSGTVWDPATSAAVFKPQRIAVQPVKLSIEFLMGAAPDVARYAVEVLSDEMSQQEGAEFANGTDNIKGWFVSITKANATALSGKTAAAIAPDIGDLDGVLVSRLRPTATAVMNDAIARAFARLQVGSSDARPVRLLTRDESNPARYRTWSGIPVATDLNLPAAIAADTNTLGVLARSGYQIVDYPQSMEVRRFEEEDSFGEGVIKLRGRHWTAGNVLRPGGIGIYKTAA